MVKIPSWCLTRWEKYNFVYFNSILLFWHKLGWSWVSPLIKAELAQQKMQWWPAVCNCGFWHILLFVISFFLSYERKKEKHLQMEKKTKKLLRGLRRHRPAKPPLVKWYSQTDLLKHVSLLYNQTQWINVLYFLLFWTPELDNIASMKYGVTLQPVKFKKIKKRSGVLRMVVILWWFDMLKIDF